MDKHRFSFVARPYVERDFAVAVLNFGKCPQIALAQLVRQVANSCAWLYGNAHKYGWPQERFYLAGHSAGGHLAAMTLLTNWRQLDSSLPSNLFSAAVLVSGLYDLRPLVPLSFINNDIRLDERSATAVSPALVSPGELPPVLTACGGLESEAFRGQTQQLVNAWKIPASRNLTLSEVNHFETCDALCNPSSPLFSAAFALMQT
jgi:arylformamidase